MSSIPLFLLCFVGLASGYLLQSVSYKMLETGSDQPGCRWNWNLTHCQPEVFSSTIFIREGTVCFDRESRQYLQCHKDGQWQFYVESRNAYGVQLLKMVKRRRKRIIGLIIGYYACKEWCPKSENPSPNTFPTIVCPSLPTQKPEVGTSMVVTWKEPVGSDNEDGKLTPRRTGLGPGSEFEEGTHFISYHVTDNGGLPASCNVVFNVKATYCSQLPWPRHGTRHCTNRDVSGSTCTVDCDTGYDVTGSSSIICEKGVWSGTLPKCQPKSCGPVPDVSNGVLTCLGDTVYGTYCLLTCNKGYETQGTLMSMCTESGDWTTPGICQDVTKPVFTFGCPDDITDYAEMRDQPKSVTWQDPEVTDNSGHVVITSSPEKGSKFTVGQTEVKVSATDEDGNMAGCSFKITINTLHCSEPDLEDDHLMYDCPDGFGIGFSCSLSCRANYPLMGTSSILCEKNWSTYPPTASWSWPDDSIKPFCRTITCPDLSVPVNGALACDTWANGPMCVMMCNELFDVPRNVPDLYTCGEQTGQWLPNDIVYDCTTIRRAGQMRLPNEFYYYSGSCFDNDTRQNIADNFINILNTSTTFQNVCGGSVPECRAELVDVRCGETTTKKRRAIRPGLRHLLNNRQTHRIKVEFIVTSDFSISNGKTFTEARSEKERLFNDVIAAVDKMVADGDLDMADKGVTVQSDSYLPAYADFHCEDGRADYEKGTCRGCPVGTYTDVSGECVDCPVGTYNDDDFANSCTSCGEGKSTKSTTSKSVDNCIDLCPVGFHSNDGMEPCNPCDPGSYTDVVGSTSCMLCSAITTSRQGAESSNDCVAYDFNIDPDTEEVLGEVNSNLTSATVTFWFRADTSAGHKLFSITNPQGNNIVTLSVTERLFVEVNGNNVDTAYTPISDQWQHLAMTLDGSTGKVKVYLKGQEVYMVTASSTEITGQSTITSEAKHTGGVFLSGITILNRVASLAEVQSQAGSCLASSSLQDSEFSLYRSGKHLIVPSLCDAVDNCVGSPCGSHPCVDEVGAFTCNCQDGWTGSTCDTPPDYCLHHECQNSAICENGQTNYTCQCKKGFKGELCQEVIVNGHWSNWTEWTACTKTCGGGVQIRSRACDSPPPDEDGDDCEGETEETATCNPDKCPTCAPLSLSFGNEKHCWQEDGFERCNVSCRAGMAFTSKEKLLPIYECGAPSGYKWNTESRPPPCSKVTGAQSYSAVHKVSYPSLPCTEVKQHETDAISQISLITSDLPCVKDGSCTASSQIQSCDSSSIQKRATEPAVVSVTITAEISSSVDQDIEIFAYNGTVTDKLKAYVEQVLDADHTVQLLVNNSNTYLRLTINGVIYGIDPDTMETTAVVNCPDGTVPADGMCAECPSGTMERDGTCEFCEKGSYQDKPASATCKVCPVGKTTRDVGATEQSDCNMDDNLPMDDEDPESVLPIVLPCVITATIMITVLAGAIIWKICTKPPSRSSSAGSMRKTTVEPTPAPFLLSTPPPYTIETSPPPYSEKWETESRPASTNGIILS